MSGAWVDVREGQVWAPRRVGSRAIPRRIIKVARWSNGAIDEIVWSSVPDGVAQNAIFITSWNAWVRKHDARPVSP